MKKNIFIVLALIAVIGVGYGYYLFNKPVSSLADVKPEYSIEASSLIVQFEDNEEKANEMYLDKIIETSGQVLKIVDNKNIYLDTGNPISSVICEMGDNQDISKLKVGDQVKIKGLCTGYLMDVVLVRSIVIK